MHFSEYQLKAAQTAIYPDAGKYKFPGINYCILGLGGEAGELQNHWSKCIRDKDGKIDDEVKNLLLKEIGDCLWFISQLCTELGVSLESVAENNLNKLKSRMERGVIGGYGDNR